MVIWTSLRHKYKYSVFKYSIVGSAPEAIMHRVFTEGKKLLDVFFRASVLSFTLSRFSQ